MWVIKSCLLILLFSNVYAWQTFFRGREFEGNIGRPYTENVITRKFPAQWFTQVLDHFNLSDSRTWQQVSIGWFNKLFIISFLLEVLYK